MFRHQTASANTAMVLLLPGTVAHATTIMTHFTEEEPETQAVGGFSSEPSLFIRFFSFGISPKLPPP